MQILPREICISMKKNEEEDTYLKRIKQYLRYFKHQEKDYFRARMFYHHFTKHIIK